MERVRQRVQAGGSQTEGSTASATLFPEGTAAAGLRTAGTVPEY